MVAKPALLIVDVQNDFCLGGALPVPEGDAVVPVLNRAIAHAQRAGWPIIASRDWHLERTSHFKRYGGRWPVHCIQGTPGAAFHPQLNLPKDAIIISKGVRPNEDSYSAFDGSDAAGVSLLDRLRVLHVGALRIGGLATDYCVKCTALDALQHGFRVQLMADAIRGVDARPGDSQRALDEVQAQGAAIVPWAG